MKTFFSNLPKILVTIFGLVVAVFIVVAMLNSLFLFKFENQFETGENIKGTECRDTISACGDLTGTDDFMYMAAALIEIKEGTKGVDEKKIKEYYEGAAFGLEGAADSSHTVKVEVFELGNNTGMFTPELLPDRTYMFNDVSTVRNFDNCYVVVIYDMGNYAPLDYRTYFA
ncbi:MAG: hypothetical protein IKJ47_04965 [Oscillospiraceae bacterium]|nr:hypothetical protein [Oscillospiraceae bacterium]